MTQYIILGVIVGVIVVAAMKLLGKKDVKKSSCPSCKKMYGGTPAKCPYCGASLRWKS